MSNKLIMKIWKSVSVSAYNDVCDGFGPTAALNHGTIQH